MLGTITKIMKMNERSYSADIDTRREEDETYSGLIATDQFDADTALQLYGKPVALPWHRFV